jgi:hypothetical protein
MDQPNMMTEDARLQQLYARRVATRGTGGGPPCVSLEAILAVVQRQGSEEDRLATLEHVMSCAACHSEYQWLMAVDQAAAETEATPGATQRQAWWRGAPLAMAASLAAIGAAVVLSGILHPGAERERGAANDIALIAPGGRASGDAPIAFTWKALPGVSRYVLEVQRPDGSVVLADTTADTVIVVADPVRRLPESNYRWWVREVTDGAELRSSPFRGLRLTGR